LPSEKDIMRRMERKGFSETRVLFYDPKEKLLPKDAERELRLSVEWAKHVNIEVDFDSFWEEVHEIVKTQGRIYSNVVLLLGRKTE